MDVIDTNLREFWMIFSSQCAYPSLVLNELILYVIFSELIWQPIASPIFVNNKIFYKTFIDKRALVYKTTDFLF